MDWLLFLTVIFVLTFLIVIAAFYVFRPDSIIIDDKINTPDVDMWRTFNIALMISTLFMLVLALAFYKYYQFHGYAALLNVIRLGCPPRSAKECKEIK